MSNNSGIFRTYIVQGIEHLLTQVEACPGQIPEPLQRNAFHLIRYAFKVEDAWQPLRQLLLQMAPKIILSAIPDDWVSCLSLAIEPSRMRNDCHFQGRLYLELGYIEQRKSNFKEAKMHFQSAADCFDSINSVRDHAWSLSRLANVQRMLKQFEDAQKNLEQVLDLLPDDDPYLVLTYMVLGWIAYDLEEWSRSQKYFETALVLSRKVGDRQREAHLLRDTGNALQMQTQFELAIQKYKQAIILLGEMDDEYDLALTEMNLSGAYLFLEQWRCALKWLAKAHARFQKYNDRRYLGMSYINQGIAIRGLGDFEKAIHLYQSAVPLFEILEETFGIANAMDEIGLTYLQMQQKEKAKQYFQMALDRITPFRNQAGYQSKYEEILRHLELCDS